MSQHIETAKLKSLLRSVMKAVTLPQDLANEVTAAIETPPVKVLAIDNGINIRTLDSRLRRGWTMERALTKRAK